MARSTRTKRARGGVEKLPSGNLRVYAYAGIDPLTGKKHYLREVIPAGPRAEAEATVALRRLLLQIDEQRNPTTNATLDQLLDRYLETADIAEGTRKMYAKYLERHVRPFIGRLKAGAVGIEALDRLYTELRRCRIHCLKKRELVDHRTPRVHKCDERCRPHVCNGLSSTTIRHIHFILRGAFEKGVKWRWVARNPVLLVDAPAARRPDPQPPTPEEAAQIVREAWEDPDWGMLVWLTMTTGARRGELCGLRWSHVDLPNGVLTIRRAIAQYGAERLRWMPSSEERAGVTSRGTYRVIADHVRRLIDDGELLPGALVPSEIALANQHGVARGTVRSALARLVDEGLIEVVPGQGRRVVGDPAAGTNTAWGRVAAALRGRLDAGQFRPDDFLPSEAVLVAEFGVSRNTVRRAYQHLADEGLVVVRQGAGRFPAPR